MNSLPRLRLVRPQILALMALIVMASGCGTDFRADAQIAATSPASITWSKVAVGQAGGPKVATLTNSGSATLNISGIGFTGTNSGDFAIYQQTCGSTLAASASCTVTILFKPTTSGSRTAALTFTDNAGDSPQEVSISGLGVSDSPGTPTASPTSLSFGSVGIGGSSASQTVTVNNGTSATINLSGAAISGSNAGDFAVSSTTCGSSLAASASCTVNLLFKPTAAGSRAAAWTVNDGSGSLSVALSGSGSASAGSASASPASITWGQVAVGQAGGPKVATLTNAGSGMLSISSIGFTGANAGDFAIYQQTCGSTLAASESCTVTVLFKPTLSGTRTANLTFTDSATNSPQQVSLTGLGTGGVSGSVTASPSSLSFGSVSQGSSSAAQTITVTNSTSASVTLSGAGISGANAGDFAVSSTTCGSSLAASASCTASITFTPTAAGARAATWNITSSSSGTPLSVALSGSGASSGGSASASPTSITWGQVAVGNAGGPKIATLTNNSGTDISISSIGLTGTNPGDFAVYQQTCGSTLAASASCTVTVLFKPTVAGTRTANLTFTDTATNSPQQVSLTGLGTGGASGSVTASPSSLSFGSVSQGSSSAAQTITVTNSTSASVTLSAAGISGANAGDFSVFSTTCGSSLAASASCTANIVFTPTATGARAATWNITSSSSSTSLSVALSGTGGSSTGSATASPSSISWNTVPVGNAGGPKTATLTNSSSATLNITGIGFTGTNSGDFSIYQQTCGSTLAASASCTVTILFKPTASGTRTATLNFTDSAGNSPQQIAVSGLGSGGASGSVTASPASLTFPQTQVGQTSSAMSATLTNGSASTMNITGITITGAQASDFIQGSTTCGATLASNASCTVSITFTPSAAGTRTASLSFADSASNSPQSVSLSGSGASGTAGSATVSPTSISFGDYAVGTTSSVHAVYLKNTGTSSISFSSAAISGTNAGDFSITAKSCGTSLGANQSCYVDVTFSPSATGTSTATLTFTDGASNSPQTVALSGNGTAAATATITISPSNLNWGSPVVGVASAPQTFTLTAGGSGSVTFSSFGFTGADAGDFSITSNTCGASLAQGATCSVTVVFTPSAIGNRVALFSVSDNAIASPQTAEVSGTGAYNNAQNASVTIDFGSRSGSQVPIPANILGTEYLESLPTNANRATVIQGGFTTARYRLDMSRVYTTSDTPSWGSVDYDLSKIVAAGVHPLIELVNTPAFLQPSPSPCPTDPATSVPTDVNEWGKLAATFVAHFDQKFPGMITQYEIWNEPDTTALCSTSSANRESDYIRIYAAAAPQMKQQGQTDGVTILVGGPGNAGPAWTDLLTNSATAPYMDFYSYHFYEGTSTDIKNGMSWDGAGGTPSLYQKVIDPQHGVQALFLQASNGVKKATTPAGAKTPIYFDEYNDDWAFVNDCCRNSPAYSPLFNSITVAQLLNSVYKGASQVPSMMIYYAAAQRTFCILGVIDSAMDCTKAATGDQAQPYPQWYTYQLMFAPSFLDLQDGGHMAASVTLSSAASSAGLIATGWYTGTTNAVLVINPTASSFSGITVQMNNPGLSSPTGTLYTINAQNPRVSQWPASTIAASGGIQTTFDLPPYSVIAISLK